MIYILKIFEIIGALTTLLASIALVDRLTKEKSFIGNFAKNHPILLWVIIILSMACYITSFGGA